MQVVKFEAFILSRAGVMILLNAFQYTNLPF